MKSPTPRKHFKAFCAKNKLVSNALFYAFIVLACSGIFSEDTTYYRAMSVVILALSTGFLASWVQVKYPNKRCVG